jgi:ankyrin repeat protein
MSDWKLELSRELTLAHKLCTYTQYWVIKRSEEEEETVRELVAMGGDMHGQDVDGATPLHMAAANGHYAETVRLLVELGSDVNARDAGGCTPLKQAANYGDVATVRTLVKMGGNALAPDADGSTLLHDAAANGHLLIVRFLVEELGGGVLAAQGVEEARRYIGLQITVAWKQ